MPEVLTVDQALTRAERLTGGPRRLLGLCGEPGAGKSTLAAVLAARLGPRCAVVGMDGFHLAQVALERLGRADRKGAPDTFDSWGFAALVERLARGEEPVWAPAFHREVEDSTAGEVEVAPEVPLVVVEGNYLLLGAEPWNRVGGLLDECWYVEVDPDLRMDRLVARHELGGLSPAAARAWARGPDERNAALVRATRDRADAVVRPDREP